MKNRLNLIFNAHLPFVRHPEYPKFLEEDWLFEAMNESYIPMLRMLFRLRDEGIGFRLTFSLSPTLCFMLTDKVLSEKFANYITSRIELGEKEVRRLEGSPEQELARMYLTQLNANFDLQKQL